MASGLAGIGENAGVRTPTFSDEAIIAGLRAAAAEGGEPLAVTTYDVWRTSRGVASSTLVIRRFGSWTAACAAAGVATNKTRSTSRRWSDDDVLAVVARYLADSSAAGESGSYAGYVAWARVQTDDVPSGPTLRQRGAWAELKAGARAAHPGDAG
jgi:Homing endonuclease associated repeat